jgi:hypothetical protein
MLARDAHGGEGSTDQRQVKPDVGVHSAGVAVV